MKRWVTNIIQDPTINAVDKAKQDITRIAENTNYNILSIFRYSAVGESDEAMHSRIDGITAGVVPGDIVFFQYPSYISIRFDIFFINHMIARGVKLILILHDVEYIRKGVSETFNEIEILNRCSALIVHNLKMKAKLKECGVFKPMIANFMFDFLRTGGYKENSFSRELVLAGSLEKSDYISTWNLKTNLIAFGGPGKIDFSKRVDYRGAVSQEKLFDALPNCFGLSWDSTPGFKEYTMYNNPYKVSMYLCMGLPVIVWASSAVADIIVKNRLGYAINTLNEIDHLIVDLSDKEIHDLLKNVRRFSALLRDGFFTKQALIKAEQQVLYGEINYF
ncbi:sugar transferase [Lactiplantibacillus plantarum]|uniref:sugar transferase n=1 Tax=Lactiplantibacillus plantarum TaxID=1590 RepID=UPI001BAAB158|nr:sugar transferase [Lactiplantibacillus plantarum]MBS0953234.1 sugar transferase [Lactiplantibacillus plantarum]